MLEDTALRQQIHALIEQEHCLRERYDGQRIITQEAASRLKGIEVELDRCWDLLRQRQAKREFRQDPDVATARSAGIVENYLQ
ncbi:DUF2630 family protein [Nocardioides conyzicola]|uniref:DUF2630 family protein n=1 Tax=Nocardioides conyzicola TaxID=1651781 RepID=A0ABP8WN08_9ACTN